MRRARWLTLPGILRTAVALPAWLKPKAADPMPTLPPFPPMQRVIELGKLNLRVLQLFEETEHAALLEAIAGLGIRRWTPPLLPTSRGGPLGYSRPPWE